MIEEKQGDLGGGRWHVCPEGMAAVNIRQESGKAGHTYSG